MATNPFREDIAGYLRRARCHYGANLLYEEDGFTVDEAAAELGISSKQVRSCRRAIHRVLDGVVADNPSQAGYDEAIIRALKHFRGEMSPELRQYLDTRHAGLWTMFSLTTGVEPLRCKYGFDNASKSTAPPHRQLASAPAGEQPPAPEIDIACDPAPEAPAEFDEAGELGYAATEEIQLVDDLAMKLALAEAARRWPDATVERMPHNNPGYDIEIRRPTTGTRYVEVKGTRPPGPCFFITAGEVAHSHQHQARYSIWIFHAMDLDAETATLTEHDGPVTEAHFELQPVQYRGRFKGRP